MLAVSAAQPPRLDLATSVIEIYQEWRLAALPVQNWGSILHYMVLDRKCNMVVLRLRGSTRGDSLQRASSAWDTNLDPSPTGYSCAIPPSPSRATVELHKPPSTSCTSPPSTVSASYHPRFAGPSATAQSCVCFPFRIHLHVLRPARVVVTPSSSPPAPASVLPGPPACHTARQRCAAACCPARRRRGGCPRPNSLRVPAGCAPSRRVVLFVNIEGQ